MLGEDPLTGGYIIPSDLSKKFLELLAKNGYNTDQNEKMREVEDG
jgi:hypothetical protein